MRTYSVNLKKVVKKTYKFLKNSDLPKHWSKTKNEKYNVHTMIKMKNIIPLTEARRRLFEITDDVQRSGVAYILTKHGRAKGVLLSFKDYEFYSRVIRGKK
mgnify:CR=1 FL=1